jgi:hypothetical protein
MSIKKFVKKRPYFFWHVKSLDKLSVDSVVENTLNYGDWEDFKELIRILGLKKLSFIFYKGLKKKRCNYRPEVKNYFKLYFKKYAK